MHTFTEGKEKMKLCIYYVIECSIYGVEDVGLGRTESILVLSHPHPRYS